MNRRTFLKSLTAACGAAVVRPGELLKAPTKYLWMRGKDGSCIGGRLIHRVVAFDESAATNKPINWTHYYMEINYEANPL